MKLLVITPYCILPADTGGKIRVFELVKGVSEQEIFVTVIMPMTPAQYASYNLNNNLTLRVVPYPFIIPYLFTDKPFSFLFLVSLHPGYHLFLRRWVEAHDVIQFEGASFGDLIDLIPPEKAVVYDAHNVEFDYERSTSHIKWVRRVSGGRTYQLEKKLTQRADRIMACTAQDVRRLCQLYDIKEDKCTVLPMGIHLQNNRTRLTVDQVRRKLPGFIDFPQRAIFSGSDVEHNREAVAFLIDGLAPLLSEKCAFLIQGRCGHPFRHHQRDNVFFDRESGTVGTYADVCTVGLNPVIQGSGISLKVLDYLAHGLPVISTAFGMRGYQDLNPYVILSDRDEFVSHLRTRQRLNPLVNRIIEKYSWPEIVQSFKQMILTLA